MNWPERLNSVSDVAKVVGPLGVLLGLLRGFKHGWRWILAPFRSEIDRERRLAREAFVADLLSEVEWYRQREDRRQAEDDEDA